MPLLHNVLEHQLFSNLKASEDRFKGKKQMSFGQYLFISLHQAA